ncbi:hypothetical protein ABT144_05940 [Streptomyces sp. NPDC002039]|uniref:hypothetical protein n=1 Tax=Streptomyces sp. NPDC002039 TaxID=3154660 RepID=UPI0033233A65
MKVLLRGPVWYLAIAGLVLAASAAFLMDVLEDNGRAALVISDVEGTWTAAGGGRLMVSADGSAELERVTEPEVNCGQSSGPAPLTYTGPAMWEFDTFPDEASGIRFDFRGPDTGKSCRIHLVVHPDGQGGKGFLPHDADMKYVRDAGRRG